MLKKIIIGIVALLIVVAVAGALSYYPINLNKAASPSPTPSTNTQAPTGKPANLTEEAAIKYYAAKQYNISEDQLVVVSSEKKVWDDTCLGTPFDEKSCKKGATSGYEMTFKINGKNVTYRGTDDGNLILFVKK